MYHKHTTHPILPSYFVVATTWPPPCLPPPLPPTHLPRSPRAPPDCRVAQIPHQTTCEKAPENVVEKVVEKVPGKVVEKVPGSWHVTQGPALHPSQRGDPVLVWGVMYAVLWVVGQGGCVWFMVWVGGWVHASVDISVAACRGNKALMCIGNKTFMCIAFSTIAYTQDTLAQHTWYKAATTHTPVIHTHITQHTTYAPHMIHSTHRTHTHTHTHQPAYH